ncbi:MAG: hypothetical protein M0C28_20660 [Candidatus Moduliflexus flocculans]|nr:hypothetical protein [Candidatus Moduliflexus flocculans]
MMIGRGSLRRESPGAGTGPQPPGLPGRPGHRRPPAPQRRVDGRGGRALRRPDDAGGLGPRRRGHDLGRPRHLSRPARLRNELRRRQGPGRKAPGRLREPEGRRVRARGLPRRVLHQGPHPPVAHPLGDDRPRRRDPPPPMMNRRSGDMPLPRTTASWYL